MHARARDCVSAACYIVHCLREYEATRDEAERERQAQSLQEDGVASLQSGGSSWDYVIPIQ